MFIQYIYSILHAVSVKGAVRRYCLQREAVQAHMISQPVKLLMQI